MSWRFCSSTGGLYLNDRPVALGYSGHSEGRNNPDLEAQARVGPIPAGRWLIEGPPIDTASHGPYVLRLEPADGTNALGRSGFLMHGDSIEHPGDASLGCIIMPRATRQQVWESGDRDLFVSHVPPGAPSIA